MLGGLKLITKITINNTMMMLCSQLFASTALSDLYLDFKDRLREFEESVANAKLLRFGDTVDAL